MLYPFYFTFNSIKAINNICSIIIDNFSRRNNVLFDLHKEEIKILLTNYRQTV